MKIKITQGVRVSSPTGLFKTTAFPANAEVEPYGDVDLEEVYNGVGIKTDQGLFGICMRDNGIEIMLDGEAVWDSHRLRGGSMEQEATGGSPTGPLVGREHGLGEPV